MLDNIRIVMIRTWHPGNIGSALRAMKTMGLRHLTRTLKAWRPFLLLAQLDTQSLWPASDSGS
ncbi:hypothetical protein GCM10023116_28270 [Kistimonas scapharcae]|uniref:tRNA/rRNA methyltransferase SpoU type domain-containing protein n=2 Tax=Kistimonas scapharcae TaxID=1036133 RepID=A0ABP8V3G2_9GAMM